MSSDTPALPATPANTVAPYRFRPRGYWLLRMALLEVIAIGLFVLARWLWGLDVDRRYDARVAELRAREESIDPADYVKLSLPDEERAVWHLNKTKMARAWMRLLSSPLPLYECPSLTRADFQRFNNVSSALDDDAAHLFAAAGCPYFDDDHLLVTAPAGRPNLSWIARVALQEFTSIAVAKARCGDVATALEYLRATLRIAGLQFERISDPNSLGGFVEIEYCVARSIESFVSHTDAPPALEHPGAVAAVHAAAKSLIDELLRDPPYLRAIHRAQLFSHIDMLNDYDRATSSRWSLSPLGCFAFGVTSELHPLHPLLRVDKLAMMDSWKNSSRISDSLSLADIRALGPRFTQPIMATVPGLWFVDQSQFGLGRQAFAVHDTFCWLTWRRLAATAVAAWLYRAEHGDYPHDLDLLVPDYLPTVPLDPFDRDAGPLRWHWDANAPRLYSVGFDGQDHDGRSDGATGTWRTPDIPFYFKDPPADERMCEYVQSLLEQRIGYYKYIRQQSNQTGQQQGSSQPGND